MWFSFAKPQSYYKNRTYSNILLAVKEGEDLFHWLQVFIIVRFRKIFLYLQVRMKNVLTSVAAMLLVVWYSLSVIGFDVHTCNGSGRTYIATVASGFTCEDIHPEKRAHTCCCCCGGGCHSHESNAPELDRRPCCTDDFQVILLTGVRIGNESYASDMRESINACSFSDASIDYSDPIITHPGLRAFYKPRSWDIVPRDVQVSYNIWRI